MQKNGGYELNPTLTKWLYRLAEKAAKKENSFRELFYQKRKHVPKEKADMFQSFFYNRLRRLTNFQDEGIQIIVDRWFDCVFMDDGMQEEQLKNYVEQKFQSKLNDIYAQCVGDLEEKAKVIGVDYAERNI